MAFLTSAPAAARRPVAPAAARTACRHRPPLVGRGSLGASAAATPTSFGVRTSAAAAASHPAHVGGAAAARRPAAGRSRHPPPRCFAGTSGAPKRGGGRGGGGGGGGGGKDDDDEDDYAERVLVRDVATGRTLPAVIAHTVVARGTSYAVCAPRDEPVVIATMTEEGGEPVLAPVDDEAALDGLFPTAASVMAENDWTLHRTAFVLTAEDLAEEEEEDEDEEDEEDEDRDGGADGGGAAAHTVGAAAAAANGIAAANGDDDATDGPDGGEEVQVLAEFCVDTTRYYVCTPYEPVVLVARTARDTGARDGVLVVPDAAELAAVTPIIEDALEAQAELL